MSAEAIIDYETLEDVRLAQLLRARDANAVRLVTTRNNQRLFRTAWSILGHRAEAEDAVQSAYLKAFAAIDGFEGRSSLSTWLTRIVINEALGRERSAKRRRSQLDTSSVTVLDDYREKLMRGSMSGTSPKPSSRGCRSGACSSKPLQLFLRTFDWSSFFARSRE